MAISTTSTTTIQQQQQQQTNNSITDSTTTAASATVSNYEQIREQRIKENRERLQKLRIVDISLQLKSISSRKNPKSQFERRSPLKSSPLLRPSEPRRRSSRLQNAPPVTYTELKEEKPRRNRGIVLEEGSKPEFYTEEHEKLLGSTEMSWTFFVDGYAADGTRIYDPVKGKTCHQCRQKTLGLRTRCSQCSLVQGQFCGDCLYMRYGEHVVEANQNPNWICPPCRGICNCSLCRQAKGWPPTGSLYRRISNLGYKSVAHYLVTTKRAPLKEDTNSETEQSAKRCLPFEGVELTNEVASDEKGTDGITAPSQTPDGVRRSGRTSKKESQMVEDQPVAEKKSAKGVGRPRKKSKKENVDGGEETLSNNSTENETVSEMKSPRRVGRPRKQSNKEHIDGGEKTLVTDVTENETVSEMKSPRRVGRPRKQSNIENESNSEMKGLRRVGRPRKQPEKESIDGGEESSRKSVMENRCDSEMKNQSVSGSMTDSVARRLRPRNKS